MDLMLKAASKDVMDSKLNDLGLLVYITNEDGDLVLTPAKKTAVSGYEGVPAPTIWTTKPVIDGDGNVTTEGVLSTEYHCNVRDLTGIIKDPTAYDEDTNPDGTDWGDVTWIDPDTVATPAMEWA